MAMLVQRYGHVAFSPWSPSACVIILNFRFNITALERWPWKFLRVLHPIFEDRSSQIKELHRSSIDSCSGSYEFLQCARAFASLSGLATSANATEVRDN